jgi:hypothetical protein
MKKLNDEVIDRITYVARNNNLNINLMVSFSMAFSGGDIYFIDPVLVERRAIITPDEYLANCRLGLFAAHGRYAIENQFGFDRSDNVGKRLANLFDVECNIKYVAKTMRHLMYVTRKNWHKSISLITAYDELTVQEKMTKGSELINVRLPESIRHERATASDT